jgi:hypothetical protein
MPAANWKARRRAAAADAQRPRPVIPQPAADGEDDPWAAALILGGVLALLAFTVCLVVAAVASGVP